MTLDTSSPMYQQWLAQQRHQQYKSAYGAPPAFLPVNRNNGMAIAPLNSKPLTYQQGLVQQQSFESNNLFYPQGPAPQQTQQYRSAYSLPALPPAFSDNNMVSQQGYGQQLYSQQQFHPQQYQSAYSLPATPRIPQNHGIAVASSNLNDVFSQQGYGQLPPQQYSSTYGPQTLPPATQNYSMAIAPVSSFNSTYGTTQQLYGQLPQQPQQYNSATYLPASNTTQNYGMAVAPVAPFNSSQGVPQQRYGQLPLQQPQQNKSATNLPASTAPQTGGMAVAPFHSSHGTPQQPYGQLPQQPHQYRSIHNLPASTAPQNGHMAAASMTSTHGIPQQRYGQLTQQPQQYNPAYSLPSSSAPQNGHRATASLTSSDGIPRQLHGKLPHQPQHYNPAYSRPTLPASQTHSATITMSDLNNVNSHQEYGKQPTPQHFEPACPPPAPQTSDKAISSSDSNDTVTQGYGQPIIQPNKLQDTLAASVINEISIVLVDHDDQSKHLWYWIEVIKASSFPSGKNLMPMTFHDSNLSYNEASRLATLYLSKISQDNIQPNAQSSIAMTLINESSTFLRYQILGVLFPLMRRWCLSAEFRAEIARCTRINRMRLWRGKAIDEPDSFTKYLEVLDTMHDRKWTFSKDPEGIVGLKTMQKKMWCYLLFKFMCTMDLVYLELMLKFNVEPYNRQRFHEVHYPAMLPKLRAINKDPIMDGCLVDPPYWPATTRVDEDVLHRNLALLQRSLD
ncbi:uncharacterized protein RAG0_14656 [Rhynchosporium agropyri]|uniref:Uncharacterized protein n=1 Tax=Rhynchosporium agropyri TaxID=914238 RepID=A0A1E1LHR8_9HELO|nr:uncharacterized protein RAG0_14656 [Rhynchosporium agropyri]